MVLLSLNTYAGAETCRLAIHDMEELMGQNSVLIDQVNRTLEKKNILLIPENELEKGDFHIADLINMIKGRPNIPMHEFKMKSRSKVVFVPCTALPLCSPVMVDKEFQGFTGIKYKHTYSVTKITEDNSEKLFWRTFKHSFNEYPITASLKVPYEGTREQEDLALAIAKDIPKCSKLMK